MTIQVRFRSAADASPQGHNVPHEVKYDLPVYPTWDHVMQGREIPIPAWHQYRDIFFSQATPLSGLGEKAPVEEIPFDKIDQFVWT